jgi:hypothetical protein
MLPGHGPGAGVKRMVFRKTIDDIVSVYNAAVFERVARKREYSQRGWLAQALLALAIAAILFAGALALFTVAAKQLYLEAYGLEVPAKVTNIAYRTENYRKTRWETVAYEFTTVQGETITGKLDRPVSELSGLPDRNHFRIAYWERFPSINAPRGVQTNGGAIMLTPLFFLFGLHFALWSKRIFGWRRTLLQAKATVSPFSAASRIGNEQ